MIPALVIWGNDPVRPGRRKPQGGLSEPRSGMGSLPIILVALALLGVSVLTYTATAIIWKIVTG